MNLSHFGATPGPGAGPPHNAPGPRSPRHQVALPSTIVLIVDDQPDVRLAFRYMLEHHEYQVLEAANGTEALACLETTRVDVILTDLYMPSMDGLSLLSAVRESPPPQPRIIAMSG